MDKITYDDYDCLSDVVCSLSGTTFIKLNVLIGNKGIEGNKEPCIKEYSYNTSKYNDRKRVVSVKRRFHSFITLEFKNHTTNEKMNIMIKDIAEFIDMIDNVNQILDSCYRKDSADKYKLVSSKAKPKKYDISDNLIEVQFHMNLEYTSEKDLVYLKLVINGAEMQITKKSWKNMCFTLSSIDIYGWSSMLIAGLMPNIHPGDNLLELNNRRKGFFD